MYFLIYNASKGPILFAGWLLLLQENSTKGKSSPHFLCKSSMYALSISSKIWFTLSVCPLISGWYELLKFNLVRKTFYKACQMALKSLSLLNTMSFSMPCNRTICLTYNYANPSTCQVSWTAMNWADLVNISTITQITFFFEAERGNPITKSIKIVSYFNLGISKGLNSPTGH